MSTDRAHIGAGRWANHSMESGLMPLMSCPDCGRQVSDQAAACPACARPLQLRLQTVQATGKKWKLWEVVAVVTLLGGIVLAMLGPAMEEPRLLAGGSLMTVMGAIGWVLSKTLAWWHHG